MKLFLIALLALGLSLLPGHVFSQTAAGGTGMRYLDLPDGSGFSEEEEDQPELIDYYSDQFEGDAFVFVNDRSSSMTAVIGSKTKFQILKEEMLRAISGLSERSVVSVTFYDGTGSVVIGDPPIKMTSAGKARVASQLTTVQTTSGSCIVTHGAKKGFELLQKTKNEFRTMFITSDGRTHCNGEDSPDVAFAKIMAMNVLRVPINTVYTGPTDPTNDDWVKGHALLEMLARATNGRCKVAH
jgi:hypothetical protein